MVSVVFGRRNRGIEHLVSHNLKFHYPVIPAVERLERRVFLARAVRAVKSHRLIYLSGARRHVDADHDLR